MKIEIKVPSIGESVAEAVLAQWYKKDGELVRKDEPLFVLETDKVTLELEAEADGVLTTAVAEGETVAIGAVVGTIDTAAVAEAKEAPRPAAPEPQPPPAAGPEVVVPPPSGPILSPAVRRLVSEKKLDISTISGTGPGGRITKGDVILHLEQRQAPLQPPDRAGAELVPSPKAAALPEEAVSRKPMSSIRRRIAERLLEARRNTAMLTTFNEIDMSQVQTLRAQYREIFQQKYGVRLGLMSFFIKACVKALKEFPEINAFIEDEDIVYHHYYHIGVAVATERGLVVPVIRHADKLSFAEIEQAIVAYVDKIQKSRLELADLEGGTFTITNGGVYGSLLSTPILNPPQSGILGMHKIELRSVAINGQISIRPMMYVALSYDHRIVDGREAVTFLVRIKQLIENPERILIEL